MFALLRLRFACLSLSLFLYKSSYCEVCNGNNHQHDDNPFDVFAVLENLVMELLFRHNSVQIPSEGGEYAVPYACADGGVEHEFPVVHLRKTCRYRYKVANARY